MCVIDIYCQKCPHGNAARETTTPLNPARNLHNKSGAFAASSICSGVREIRHLHHGIFFQELNDSTYISTVFLRSPRLGILLPSPACSLVKALRGASTAALLVGFEFVPVGWWDTPLGPKGMAWGNSVWETWYSTVWVKTWYSMVYLVSIQTCWQCWHFIPPKVISWQNYRFWMVLNGFKKPIPSSVLESCHCITVFFFLARLSATLWAPNASAGSARGTLSMLRMAPGRMVIIGISLESTWIHPSGSYPGYSWIFRHSIWYSPNCPNSDSWRIHLFRQHRGGFCGAQIVFWYRVFINFMAQLLPCLSSHLWSSSASVCCRCQNPLHPTYTEAEQLFFGNLEQFIGLFLRTWRAIGVFVDILCWQLQQRDTSGTKNLRCSAPSAATTVAAFRCYFWLDTPVWQWLVDGICSPLIENLWLKTSFFSSPEPWN